MTLPRPTSKRKKRLWKPAVLAVCALCLTLLPGCFGTASPSPIPGASPPVSSAPAENPSAIPSGEENPPPTPSEEVVPPTPRPGRHSYDVIVYGGTPAGVMAAVTAVRTGLRAAIIEPTSHIGGIVTSGLCYSDTRVLSAIGGLSREFFIRTGIYYNYGVALVYSFEPHIAQQVFDWFVEEAGIDVYENLRLKQVGGVQKDGALLTSVTTEDGSVFSGKQFIDASYEGDLMAQAGVSYTVGRESFAQYGEDLAGVRPPADSNNFFQYDLSAYAQSGELLPGIAAQPLETAGKADGKVSAYNYRLCITDRADNRIAFTRPQEYDPAQYELLLRWLLLLKQSEGGRDLGINDVFSLGPLPDGKYDANHLGAFSSDYIGESWDYPQADCETRELIARRHRTYLQGLFYFLTNDPRVPAELRTDMARWGLAADEYTDNGCWPYQLYVREARRMVGAFVMTQADVQTNREKLDTVGLGSYSIDSHHVQRIVTEDGYVQNEGEIQVPVLPYQLPYRIMLPREAQAENLLVPVCVSASHVAYSAIRMEPQFMVLGQAAGAAAYLAIEERCSVQKIDINHLKALLTAQGAVLSLDGA